MATRIDPKLLEEIKDYGANEIEKCFNCGNCTAICTLTTEEDHFPRKIIRFAQLGMKDRLLSSPELWLCYNCGECSETCPQQAEPANFMTAARCYAITHYDPIGLGRIICTKPIIGTFIVLLMLILTGLFMFTSREQMPSDSLKLFNFIPYELIHTIGLISMIVIGCLSLITIFNMISHIARYRDLSAKDFLHGSRKNWIGAFWDAVVVQSLGQKRYINDCCRPDKYRPWYLTKWFIHAATMWGFLGLLLATALDYLLDIIGIKQTGSFVPIWNPIRLLGTLSGLLFIYGVTILLFRRIRETDKAHSNSRPADWIFLSLLWFSGITGFIIEIGLYLPDSSPWFYWVFLVHISFSGVLLLLLPFTKFAHAIYRIVALYVHALKPVSSQDVADVQPASTD